MACCDDAGCSCGSWQVCTLPAACAQAAGLTTLPPCRPPPQALTAVEHEDGWQAVTSTAPRGDPAPHKGGTGAASAPPLRTGVADVLEGVGSAMELDPQPWEPDSSSATCR